MIGKQGVSLLIGHNGVQDKTALDAANETVNRGVYDATLLSTVDPDLAVGNIKLAENIFGKVGTHSGLEDYAVNASGGLFRRWAAIGMATSENINDNDTGTILGTSVQNQYAEVAFGDLVKIKRWQQYGNNNNERDGEWKIQYWNVETNAWVDWVTGIPTIGVGWSGYSTESEVITTKIKLIATTIDSQGLSRMNELEVIY